jgi:chromosome segregation ATPase
MSGEDGILIQRRQLKEHRKSMESNKLGLWKLKSDLASVTDQLAAVERQLHQEEQSYADAVRRKKTRGHKLATVAMSFTKAQAEALLEISSPTTMVQDVASIVTQLFGCVSASWSQFVVRARQTLLKDFDSFYEGMKATNLDVQSLDSVAQLVQKHQLSLLVGEGRLPDELAPLVIWALAACELAESEAAVKEFARSLPRTSAEKQILYLHKQELEDTVDDVEAQLRETSLRIKKCENNMAKLGEKAGEEVVSSEFADKKQKVRTDAPAVIFEESSLKSDFYSEEISKPHRPTAMLSAEGKPGSVAVYMELQDIVIEPSSTEQRRQLIAEEPRKKKKKRIGCCGLR